MTRISRRHFAEAASAAIGLALTASPPLSGLAAATKGASASARRTLQVGTSRGIRTLREASIQARDGDLVLVDPGVYRSDVAVWTQRDLVIRAEGNGATLAAHGASAEDKGTFVFRGSDAVLENLTFVGARSRDGNGAGIRMDNSVNLTVRKCGFEENENGILASNDIGSVLTVIDSAFTNNGAGDGQTHNLYVGQIARLSVSGCYFARAHVGHLLKTRARESFISYSRLSGEDGTSSYELEFPSGGRAAVIGCVIEQGPKTENATIISYGAEGLRWDLNELLISFCTIVNNRRAGSTILKVAPVAVRVEMLDNVLLGSGDLNVNSANVAIRNVQARPEDFADPVRYDYRLRRSSRLVGAAGMAGVLDRGRERPDREYVHPAGTTTLLSPSPLTALSPGAFQRVAP